MRIIEFWARGYRSLVDIRIETARPFNVLYGPNGAGKSNILEALETLSRLVAYRAKIPGEDVTDPLSPAGDAPLNREDRTADRERSVRKTILGATLEDDGKPFNLSKTKKWWLHNISIEVIYTWSTSSVELRIVGATGADGLPEQLLKLTEVRPVSERKELDDALRHFLIEEFGERAYSFVSADRYPQLESTKPDRDVTALLRKGELFTALANAERHPDPSVRRRLKAFRTLMEGPPFARPPFEIVEDPKTKQIDLREPLPTDDGPLGEPRDVSLRLAGLGVAQVYSIVAQLLLSGAKAAGIEEPEAHLHAPTSGRNLRELLERIVEDGHLDQLFIATHSNLFDLDPEGYLDVSFDEERGTVVTRESLKRIDEKHLYEPGPAKHALVEFLRTMGGDEDIGLRTADGEVVTTAQMLERLQCDDALALDFLREMHSAAARLAMLRQRKKAPRS